MLEQCSPSVLSTLSDLPRDSFVRVVVKGVAADHDVELSGSVSPKDYASATEYRAALIRQHKQRTQGTKSALAEKAEQMGLVASPASSLNAVTVEGSPQKVLELLKQVDIEAAVVERALDLAPLPRPR